jgi:predicted Rossmann-fold nucleotide-binding protein
MIPIILVVGSHKDKDGETYKTKCETVAGLLVKHGVHLLTGGGPGVMAKVSQFFVEHPERKAGQRCLGVLPWGKEGYPNKWVEIPIRTHLSGKMMNGADSPKDSNSRNHINALTASAVIGFQVVRGLLLRSS